MKRAFIAFLFWLSACALVCAQVGTTWCMKPMVGVNLSRVTGDRLHTGIPPYTEVQSVRMKTGMMLGADLEWIVVPAVGLSAGLYYSQQGYRYNDYANLHDPKIKLYYLQVPLLVNLYVAEGLAFKVGLQGGVAVKQQYEYSMDGGDDEQLTMSAAQHGYRDFDWGVPIGLSYTLEFMEFQILYTFGRYDISSSRRAQPIHSRNISLTIGYRFEL